MNKWQLTMEDSLINRWWHEQTEDNLTNGRQPHQWKTTSPMEDNLTNRTQLDQWKTNWSMKSNLTNERQPDQWKMTWKWRQPDNEDYPTMKITQPVQITWQWRQPDNNNDMAMNMIWPRVDDLIKWKTTWPTDDNLTMKMTLLWQWPGNKDNLTDGWRPDTKVDLTNNMSLYNQDPNIEDKVRQALAFQYILVSGRSLTSKLKI